MVTFHIIKEYSGGKVYKEGVCLESDTKPVTDRQLLNGSKLLEMDTSKRYRYDEENATWIEQVIPSAAATETTDDTDETDDNTN